MAYDLQFLMLFSSACFKAQFYENAFAYFSLAFLNTIYSLIISALLSLRLKMELIFCFRSKQFAHPSIIQSLSKKLLAGLPRRSPLNLWRIPLGQNRLFHPLFAAKFYWLIEH